MSRALTDKQVEALTVAMIVAPGVYARNRMFELFTSPGARRARTRASLVRGIARQLGRASEVTVAAEALGRKASDRSGPETLVLRYVVPAVSLSRVVELTRTELAALRLVAERANVRVLPPADEDAELVRNALRSLMEGDEAQDVVRLVSSLPPPPG